MKQGKRWAKRIFSALLTLTMLFVSFPTAFSFDAAAASTTSGKTGKCTWTLDGTVLTISGNGAMETYSTIQPSWGREITRVIIKQGVTNVGPGAFAKCIKLTSVTLSDSVTRIENSAFSGCTNLTNITLPGNVTSIEDSAFSSCTGLTSFTFPDSVTSIGKSAFSGCTGLTRITIPDGYIMHYTFAGCTGLTNITLPGNVRGIGRGAFGDCINLKSITLPDNLTIICDDAFSNCKSLTSINIPNKLVRICKNAFRNCQSLKHVDMPSVEKWCNIIFENSYSTPFVYGAEPYIDGKKVEDLVIPDGVTSIGDFAFSEFSGLRSIDISDSVTNIGEYTFAGCTSLTSITIPDSVIDLGKGTFLNCKSLASIALSGGLTSIDESVFYGCTGLTSIAIPSNVKNIGSYAFYACTGLTSITFSDSVTSIGESAFRDCKNLTSITLTDNVTNIGSYAFLGCTKLASINIPANVTSIGSQAFYLCENLKRVDITNIEKWCAIEFGYQASPLYGTGADLYLNGKMIEDLVIPDGVTCIGDYCFYGCGSMTGIIIPDSVTSIGRSAFSYCTGLTNITIPNGVTNIGESAFRGCTGLTSIAIPDSVKNIGDSAFRGCNNLTSITIPDSVTSIGKNAFSSTGYAKDPQNWDDSVLYISNYLIEAKNTLSGNYSVKPETTYIVAAAFSGCKNLTGITLSDSITHVGTDAFYNCKIEELNITEGSKTVTNVMVICKSTLKRVIIPDSVTNIADDAFDGCSNLVIWAAENSAAHQYAKAHEIRYYLTRVDTQASKPTVESSQKADESSVTVTLQAVGGYEYRCDEGAWQNSPVFTGLSFGGQYRFYQRLAESEISVAGPASEPLVVTLKNKNSTAPAAPAAEHRSDDAIVLQSVPGCEYSLDGETWQSDTRFTGLDCGTAYTFYQRFAETELAYAGKSSVGAVIKTDKGLRSAPGAPVLESRVGDTVTLKSVDGCEYSKDGVTWQTSESFVGVDAKENLFFYQRFEENDRYYVSPVSQSLFVGTADLRACRCKTCSGEGRVVDRIYTCYECQGKGFTVGAEEWNPCSYCKGSGKVSVRVDTVCPSCNGLGGVIVNGQRISCSQCSGKGTIKAWKDASCSGCSGKGGSYTRPKFTCSTCRGDCYIKRYKNCADCNATGKTHTGSHTAATCISAGRCFTCGEKYGTTDPNTHRNIRITNAVFSGGDRGHYDVDIYCYDCASIAKITLEGTAKHVFIPKGVMDISENAFENCKELTDVYYEGSQAEWNALAIASGNDNLTKVKLHFGAKGVFIPGDLDGDEKITDADAVYLLMHTFFPDEYPVDQGCDFDGDGKVNDADAVYLLMYTFFPDEYPIQ